MYEQNINMLTIKTVLEVFKNNFFVPSYQRGYRWTENEVKRLLDDIYTNKEKNYCLQPVVIKKLTNNKFELIDGQQRITTLFILLQYIKTKFNIPIELETKLEYETRKDSENYIKEINKKERFNNIDYCHMYNAYETIEEWFNQQKDNKQKDPVLVAFEIYLALSKSVKVIWYEIGENENAIDLFTRLNIGKIPLTNAELVKALFLADSNETISENKKQEIAFQWDYIEKELHNEDFWNFLTNQKSCQTRIDLVLNLVNKKNENPIDPYQTFFEINEKLSNNEETVEKLWNKILQTFYLIKEWNEDFELYHKIGYLIAASITSLLSLFNLLEENTTKSEFKAKLTQKIKESIGNTTENKDFSIDTFSYENPAQAKNLLLLFNIETICQSNDKSYRFPFHTYKKQIWSLEHIHAQNSEDLPQGAWKNWLEEYKETIIKMYGENKQEELHTAITQVIEKTNFEQNALKKLQENILKLFQEINENSIHSIDNLALLGKDNNSALNNSTFEDKREKIIELDKNGEFIPPCTRNVFLKYYTLKKNYQIYYWGMADREAYKKAITQTLKEYLK